MDKFSLEAWRHYPESRLCPAIKMPEQNELFDGHVLQNGFAGCKEILSLADTSAITEKTRQNAKFGLLLDACGGIIEIREGLARLGLQRVWEEAPVLLKAQGSPDDIQSLARAAAGWHVAATDIPLPGLKPAAMALRRLTFPTNLSAAGAMPLRFWWQNVGDAPLYESSKVRLMLRGGDIEAEIPVNDESPIRNIGDYTHNEITRLPDVPAGDYDLLCGMFARQANPPAGANPLPGGTPLPLAIDAPEENGYYLLGTVTLDDVPRPELFDAWDDYYPDGYYPTEDPKLPV